MAVNEGPNELVVIGWLGTRTAYLNVGLLEAMKRYCAQNDIEPKGDDEQAYRLAITTDGATIEFFKFKDEFFTYDAGPL